MPKKVLIPLHGDDVAPRFDLATEILMAEVEGDVTRERTVVLPQASAEELCHIVLTEGVDVVICGGIEEEYYQYLVWKRVMVFDSVLGPVRQALDRFVLGGLKPGDILYRLEADPMP